MCGMGLLKIFPLNPKTQHLVPFKKGELDIVTGQQLVNN